MRGPTSPADSRQLNAAGDAAGTLQSGVQKCFRLLGGIAADRTKGPDLRRASFVFGAWVGRFSTPCHNVTASWQMLDVSLSRCYA